jgi:putative transposase
VAIFQVKENAEILIAKLMEYRDKKNYLLHEFVVMPNHLHLLLTPGETTSIEKSLQLIKGGSSHQIHSSRGTRQQIWQLGFHESRIRDFDDYKKKADYIHFNPVAAKLVEKPEEWFFGSTGGGFVLDPMPQGLKPHAVPRANVGAKAPTPQTIDTNIARLTRP